MKDDAGAGRRAAAREGSSQGQPDAEPREHRQPHVASRAAGDLLRPPLRPRRDAGRRRAGDRRRHAAGGAGSVRQRLAGGDRARPGTGLLGAAVRASRVRSFRRSRKLDRSADHDSARTPIPRWARIWSDQRRYETWLEVELAAADAMADAGIVPADAAREHPREGARSTSPGSRRSNRSPSTT